MFTAHKHSAQHSEKSSAQLWQSTVTNVYSEQAYMLALLTPEHLQRPLKRGHRQGGPAQASSCVTTDLSFLVNVKASCLALVHVLLLTFVAVALLLSFLFSFMQRG